MVGPGLLLSFNNAAMKKIISALFQLSYRSLLKFTPVGTPAVRRRSGEVKGGGGGEGMEKGKGKGAVIRRRINSNTSTFFMPPTIGKCNSIRLCFSSSHLFCPCPCLSLLNSHYFISCTMMGGNSRVYIIVFSWFQLRTYSISPLTDKDLLGHEQQS